MSSNNLTVLDRTRRENQLVFVNQTQIPGIQSISFNNEARFSPLKHIGLDSVRYVSRGPQEGTCAITNLIIDARDPFLQFTGHSGFNLYVLQNKNDPKENYGFTSGYISSYTTRCSVGEIPSTEIQIVTYGNIGRIPSGESTDVLNHFTNIPATTFSQNLMVAGPGSIELSIGDFRTNRVLSYEITYNIPREAVYPLGRRTPTQVNIVFPIEITCNFEIDVNDYSGTALRRFPCNPKTTDLTLRLRAFDTNQRINTFNFYDLRLLSERYETTVNGNTKAFLQYYTYITRLTDDTTLPRLVDESGLFFVNQSGSFIGTSI